MDYHKEENNYHSQPGKGASVSKSAMAQLVETMDWSQTPLGPMEAWPQSLKTTVSLCLASNFPISIAWGPNRVQIYNDGYWPICGNKHPRSMGQDYKECWWSAWPAIGEAFEQASLGQTRFLENQRMFLDRYGYLEETFFTFSFSPILDESGKVGGLFHPVTELTQQTLAERRLTILRTLADHTANARTEQEASNLVFATLKSFDLDLPFVLLYALSPDAKEAQLEGSIGVNLPASVAPPSVKLEEVKPEEKTEWGWSFSQAVQRGQASQVDELAKRFGPYVSGPYEEPPKTALVFPLSLSGVANPQYMLVMGVSARRSLDEKYRLFYDLLAAAVTNALAKARAYQEERKRAEALAELDRAKTAFFSNISHEFRTPLSLMLGPLEDSLLDKVHPLPQEQAERLELVQRNTLRLQRLVNSLLDFSRIESGRLQARFVPTDVAAYTAELASVFRSAMEKAGLVFRIHCQTHSQTVFVDHDMWEKMVFNLLSNALKFTFSGSVEVSLTEEPGTVVLQVRDTGEGIPAEELSNLFKRFYRIEGTKSRTYEGSGIGLAFVQELVKLHGGTIEAKSEVNHGTTFTIRIPTGSEHLPPEQVRSEKAANPRVAHSNVFLNESMQWLSNPSLPASADVLDSNAAFDPTYSAAILVVDDNTDMRDYVSRILNRHPNWQIQTARDGLQALEMIKQHKPDLVLSDIMMPELDGFGLLKALKARQDTASIPVILLSARAGEEATLEGLEKGADDYLIKPFSARELLARVNNQLEITRTRQDNTLLREAEEELKKFKIISDYAFDAFILMREDGTFAYLNDLALKQWGYTRQEAYQLRVPDVDPIYQEDKFNAVFALAQQQGAIPAFETIHRRKDGSTFPVEVSMGSVTLDDQPHLFAVARDIARRKQAEQSLQESEREAQALAEELAAANEELRLAHNQVLAINNDLALMNTQLRRTNVDLDNFIYAASHDLKAPISNIEGLMQALLRTLPTEQLTSERTVRIMEMIQHSVERFKKTISNLTEVVKLQKENSAEAVSVSLINVMQEVLLDMEPHIRTAGAQLEVDVTHCPSILFSEKNLRSVIYNLLSNAIKYRAPNRTALIRIQCETVPDYYVLSVIDNGLGMNISKDTKLFTMFKRFHDHVEGTGIGLYMVKKMVENAGGKIEVESQVGVGSTFRVYFPR